MLQNSQIIRILHHAFQKVGCVAPWATIITVATATVGEQSQLFIDGDFSLSLEKEDKTKTKMIEKY